MRPIGWRHESYRHSLAAHGVHTRRYMAPSRSILWSWYVGDLKGAQEDRQRIITAAPAQLAKKRSEAYELSVRKPLNADELKTLAERRETAYGRIGEKERRMFEPYIDAMRAKLDDVKKKKRSIVLNAERHSRALINEGKLDENTGRVIKGHRFDADVEAWEETNKALRELIDEERAWEHIVASTRGLKPISAVDVALFNTGVLR